MSIFGSLTTAVLGLSAQSNALGHISDNIANAQTLGYKRVNTSFETLVLESSSRVHSPGGLTVKPIFVNNIQGALQQVQSPTNVSIQGQGFFSVSKLASGQTGPGQVGDTVQTQTGTLNADNVFYTRVGDFQLDKNRYLVNSAGFALNGWAYDSSTGQLNKDVIEPIQVNTLIDKPTSTTQIDYSANLPATPAEGVKIPTSSIQIFDTQGNARTVNLNWRQQGANDWRLFLSAPDSSLKPVSGSFDGNAVDISLGQNVVGRTAIPQVSTITVGGANTNGQDQLRVGEVFTVTVDGTEYSVEITEDNVSEIQTYSGLAGALANEINSATPTAPVLATVSGAIISLTARTAGERFKVSQEVTDESSVSNAFTTGTNTAATTSTGEIQKLSLPQSQIDVGDVFGVTIDDGSGSQTVTITVTALNYATYLNAAGVMEALANKINSTFSNCTASSTGSVLAVQMDASGASFISAPAPATGTISGIAFGTSGGVSNASSAQNNMAISLTQANVTGVRQQQTVTLVGTPGDVGAVYSISINDSPVTYTTTGDETSMEEISAALATKINSNTSLPVTASASGGVIKLVAKTAVTKPVTGTISPSTLAGAANTVSLTASQIDIGDTYTITTTGGLTKTLTITAGTYTQYDTIAEVMDGLAALINADSTFSAAGVTATPNSDGTLTLVGDTGFGTISEATDNSFSLQQSATAGQTPAHIALSFGTDVDTVGTLTSISTAYVGTGTAVSSASQSEGTAATVSFQVDYGFGPQTVVLNLGTYGEPGGVTQYAGTEINVTQFVQDGAPRGQFKDVVFNDDGEVLVNYDNGRSKKVARVPVVNFNDPNQLQRLAGGVFIETQDSGKPNFNDADSNGAGAIIANSVEGSNVDIADEFTKLIVTQRTYSANTKIVTTSDEMLQEVLNLKR